MEIPDDRIASCIDILQQLQPRHLDRLSAGAESIMNSMVNGEFWSSSPSRLEGLEEREIFASVDMRGATYDYLF